MSRNKSDKSEPVKIYESLDELLEMATLGGFAQRKFSISAEQREVWAEPAAGEAWNREMEKYGYDSLYNLLEELRQEQWVTDPDNPDVRRRIWKINKYYSWHVSKLAELGLSDASDEELLQLYDIENKARDELLARKPEIVKVWYCDVATGDSRWNQLGFNISKDLYDQLFSIWPKAPNNAERLQGRLSLSEMNRKLNGKDKAAVLAKQLNDKKAKLDEIDERNRIRAQARQPFVQLYSILIADGPIIGVDVSTMTLGQIGDLLKREVLESEQS